MYFTIHPLTGVNDIAFGMSPGQVRQAMASVLHSGIWRAVSRESPSDHFDVVGAFAYYDAEEGLEAMEFREPAQMFLGGVDPFALPASQASSVLFRLDSEATLGPEGVTSVRAKRLNSLPFRSLLEHRREFLSLGWLCKEFGYLDRQRQSKPLDHIDSRVFQTSFHPTDIGAVDSGIYRQGFLRNPTANPNFPEIPGN